MAKTMSKEGKEVVGKRLDNVMADVDVAKKAVEKLTPQKATDGQEYYTAEEDSADPGGKPCGKLYDAEDNIKVALIDLGGRPCGGGKPC